MTRNDTIALQSLLIRLGRTPAGGGCSVVGHLVGELFGRVVVVGGVDLGGGPQRSRQRGTQREMFSARELILPARTESLQVRSQPNRGQSRLFGIPLEVGGR